MRQTGTYELHLTFTLRRKTTGNEAYATAVGLAEHVLDTFNDDNSIKPLVHVEAKTAA